MSALSEVEIFDLMFDRLKSAAEKCELLAWHPMRGHVYWAMVKELKEIEGCCRQAALHREHSPWFVLGLKMEEVHKRCGHWMRNSPTKEARDAAHPLFKKLAEKLREIAYAAEQEKNAAVGRLGAVLPDALPGPHRDTRPVSVILPYVR